MATTSEVHAGEPLARKRALTDGSKNMKRINFALTVEELRLLVSLASDQLFRRQFIDPRMPGYKGSPEELDLGKALVGRMRLIMDEGKTAAAGAQTAPGK